MSTKEVSKNEETKSTSVADLDMKLEVVVIPVSDVDRAKSFYLSSDGGSMPTAPLVTTSAWSSSHLAAPAARSNLA